MKENDRKHEPARTRNENAASLDLFCGNMTSVKRIDHFSDLLDLSEDGPMDCMALIVIRWPHQTVPFDLLKDTFSEAVSGLDCQTFLGDYEVPPSNDEDELDVLIGDNGHPRIVPIPPSELPACLLVGQTAAMSEAKPQYLRIPAMDLLLHPNRQHQSSPLTLEKHIRQAVHQMEDALDLDVVPEAKSEALRIFVAGDRSSVGKSSVCLGIIGNLLAQGYATHQVAYIKPATQSEAPQLIEHFCQSKGIRCVPIGPLVYYRGFTRAFLAGETASTEEWLAACGAAVDRVARNKKVVLVDGVGFPAVGSICGTDNAQVLKACSYPTSSDRQAMGVVLVGGVGVGAAVDAFNLNATYFASAGVPVLGAIFNKLPADGFYSLEQCRDQVTSYMEQYQPERKAFGFVPLFPGIVGPQGMDHVQEYLDLFGQHVAIESLLEAAQRVKEGTSRTEARSASIDGPEAAAGPPRKRMKTTTKSRSSREVIEQTAIRAGAQKSA